MTKSREVITVTLTIATRHPEDFELINHADGNGRRDEMTDKEFERPSLPEASEYPQEFAPAQIAESMADTIANAEAGDTYAMAAVTFALVGISDSLDRIAEALVSLPILPVERVTPDAADRQEKGRQQHGQRDSAHQESKGAGCAEGTISQAMRERGFPGA